MNTKQIALDVGIMIIIPGILVAVYFLFFQSDPVVEVVNNDTGMKKAVNVALVKEALAIVDSIKFDNTVFDDPVFQTLTDQTVPIVDQPIGRDNPFIPSAEILRQSVYSTGVTGSQSAGSR